MTKAEALFHEIAAAIPDAIEGKMFGALCIKAPNGKAGVMFWKEFMVFKLEGKALQEALNLDEARLFDPMGGRPMNGWVQLSYDHSSLWEDYARQAMKHVAAIETAPAKKKSR
jgi:hypothetical protein